MQQPAPVSLRLLLGLTVLLSSISLAHAGIDWQWRTGRITHYGGASDPWSIHHGSCGFKYLDPTVNKGWDVAALADADGYGTGLDRSNVCYDTSQTLVVMITDTCPCNYPPNAYSNKRWCCGDYYHFDVSIWAFERLAPTRYGVIGIRYRQVPCDYCPDKQALLPNGQQPSGGNEAPPGDWQPSHDRRPYGKMCFKSSKERQDGGGGGGNDNVHDSSSQASSSSSSSRSSSSQSGSNHGRARQLFPSNSLLSGWKDLTSNVFAGPWTAPDGTTAYCGSVSGYGGLQFESPSGGSLLGKRTLSIDIKTNQGQVPDFTLNLASSSKGSCRSIDLRQASVEFNQDWAHLTIPLVNVNWFSQWSTNARQAFTGCSDSIGAWDVDRLEFGNKWGSTQSLCLANVKAN